MLRLLLKLYWKLAGWKVAGNFPAHYKKMVLAVAPHTSWKDVLVGFATRNVLNIHDAKFLGKKELFDGPFGFLFRWLGGIPVDRFSKQGMVEQVVALFQKSDSFLLAMAPEGTRKRVDKLRSGFYHIAKKAGAPIQPVGLDYENRRIVLGEIIVPGDDEAADFQKIIAFFSRIKGANPAGDLSHLDKKG